MICLVPEKTEEESCIWGLFIFYLGPKKSEFEIKIVTWSLQIMSITFIEEFFAHIMFMGHVAYMYF